MFARKTSQMIWPPSASVFLVANEVLIALLPASPPDIPNASMIETYGVNNDIADNPFLQMCFL